MAVIFLRVMPLKKNGGFIFPHYGKLVVSCKKNRKKENSGGAGLQHA